jgi:2-C-methyl-D-erythritol 4-phosphate cytidylyltransferase
MIDLPEIEPTLGLVVDDGRGSLPFALIHGDALVACAAWALGEAGVDLVDLTVPWAGLAEAGEAVVLHDPLCPMTPADFVVECVRAAEESDQVVVAVRPVTDTLKSLDGTLVGPTVDRDTVRQVASPIVLPATVVGRLDGLPTTDFAALVAWLAGRFGVRLIEAPASARRVGSLEDIRLLEALTVPA